MRETSKAHSLRLQNGDFTLYLHGQGIDIGAGDDPLRPPDGAVRNWDRKDGDAQNLPGIPDDFFDFVYSSHCLEHVHSVEAALTKWAGVCTPNGFVYVVVPEWTFYEHRQWPSRHNRRHRSSFALVTAPPPEHAHYTIADLLRFGHAAGLKLVDARLDLEGFEFSHHSLKPHFVDQTRHGAQAQMTIIWQKIAVLQRR